MHWWTDTLVDDDWWLVVGFGCGHVHSLGLGVGWGRNSCLLVSCLQFWEDVLLFWFGGSVRCFGSLGCLDLLGFSVSVLRFLGCLVTFLELGQFGKFGQSVGCFGSFGRLLEDSWRISGSDVSFRLLVDVDWWMTGVDDVWRFGSFRNDRSDVLDLGCLGCLGCLVALDFGCLGCLVALGLGNLGRTVTFTQFGEFEFGQLG